MTTENTKNLLDAVLDSWDRNNTILVNLVRVLPPGALEVRAVQGSPSVGEMLAHMHYVRLVLIAENAPELAPSLFKELPAEEWAPETDAGRIAQMLNESGKAVREAAKAKLESGGEMKVHYDHPILFLQHLIWHEGYHHGQIKLALKLAGHPIDDDLAGPVTWHVWFDKANS
jgi:uncharacterized damage-inducible protein DinB